MTSSEMRNKQGERLDASYHPGDMMNHLVIIGHGVTGNKDRPLVVAVAKSLVARGWPCLRVSFSGNGNSDGDFRDSTIAKEREDLKAVLATVPVEKSVIYVGHSMGAAVGVLVAKEDIRIQVLVSLAGMTHTAEFFEREFGDVVPGEGNMWDEEGCPLSQDFVDDMKTIGSTLEAAAAVRQPWLLVHGSEDDVVPVKDGLDAFAAAKCEKKWVEVEGAGHSFGEESYGEVVDAIDDWLRRIF